MWQQSNGSGAVTSGTRPIGGRIPNGAVEDRSKDQMWWVVEETCNVKITLVRIILSSSTGCCIFVFMTGVGLLIRLKRVA